MIDSLVRKHLRSFQPYRSARSEMHQASIFLDANELSLGSPVSFEGVDLNRYPDPYQIALREKLAERFGISSDMIFTGVGSDEIIDLMIRLFCEPATDRVMVLEPTYGVYRVASDVNAVQVKTVQLDETFQIDLSSTLQAITPDVKILFCCSPNNPTGNLLRRDDILALCEQVRGIVVVDEAYIEFSEGAASLLNDISRVPNLVVLRTLSKAWGLAGIRLGYCIAHPSIVSYLLAIKSPYNLNAVTIQLACQALSNTSFFEQSRSTVIAERDRVRRGLERISCVRKIYPSDTNFLLIEFGDPRKVFEALYRNGIVVRRRNEPRLSQCLRMTIGRPEENSLVLKILSEM